MSWPQRPTKFVKAKRPFKSFAALLCHLQKGGWVYFGKKPYHPSVIRNWQLGAVLGRTQQGWFHAALPNPKHPSNQLVRRGDIRLTLP